MRYGDFKNLLFVGLLSTSLLIEVGCGSNSGQTIGVDQNELLKRRAADDSRTQTERNNFNRGVSTAPISLSSNSATTGYANNSLKSNQLNKNTSSPQLSGSSGGGISTAMLALAFTGVAAWIAGPSVSKGMNSLLSKTGKSDPSKKDKSEKAVLAPSIQKNAPTTLANNKQQPASILSGTNLSGSKTDLCASSSQSSAAVEVLSNESSKIFGFSNSRSTGGTI